MTGCDLENPNFKYPGTFSKQDIKDWRPFGYFDFITCISVLEHIEEGQDEAIAAMIGALKIGGRLLLTIPTHEFAQGHPWHGFNTRDLNALLPKNCGVAEYTERAGQLCLCIVRTS